MSKDFFKYDDEQDYSDEQSEDKIRLDFEHDIYELDGKLYVELEVADLDEDSVELKLVEDKLVIIYRVEDEAEIETNRKYYVRSVKKGKILNVVKLPVLSSKKQIVVRGSEFEYSDGLLRIIISLKDGRKIIKVRKIKSYQEVLRKIIKTSE